MVSLSQMFGVLVTFVCFIACSGERAGLDLHTDLVLSADGKFNSLDEVITHCAEFGAAVVKEEVGNYRADLNTVEKLCQSPITGGKIAEIVIVQEARRMCPELRKDGEWYEAAEDEQDAFMVKFNAAAQVKLCESADGADDFESFDDVVTHCANFGATAMKGELVKFGQTLAADTVKHFCSEDGQTLASKYILPFPARLCPEFQVAGSKWRIETDNLGVSFAALFNAKMSAALCSIIGDSDP